MKPGKRAHTAVAFGAPLSSLVTFEYQCVQQELGSRRMLATGRSRLPGAPTLVHENRRPWHDGSTSDARTWRRADTRCRYFHPFAMALILGLVGQHLLILLLLLVAPKPWARKSKGSWLAVKNSRDWRAVFVARFATLFHPSLNLFILALCAVLATPLTFPFFISLGVTQCCFE